MKNRGYSPILVESDVLSAGDWRSLGWRLAFSTKEIDIIVFAFI